jgi:hypothetical protein
MPIRNEGAFIERSLAAALAQDHLADLLEVLAVDGMSDDGTQDIVLPECWLEAQTPNFWRTPGRLFLRHEYQVN